MRALPLLPLLLLLAAAAAAARGGVASGGSGCRPRETALRLERDARGGGAVLQNGFLCVETRAGRVSAVRADFNGGADFGGNVLARDGLALRRETPHEVAMSARMDGLDVVRDSPEEKVIRLVNVGDDVAAENWTIGLRAASRTFSFEAQGSVRADAAGRLSRAWDFAPASIYAFYEDSVVQMRNAEDAASYFASQSPLRRVYALGAHGPDGAAVANKSIDVVFLDADGSVVDVRAQIGAVGRARRVGTALRSSARTQSTGFEEFLAGTPPGGPAGLDRWTQRQPPSSSSTLTRGLTWRHRARIGANNFDFPAAGNAGGSEPQMPFPDLRAFMTALYGTPVGTLMTHRNAVLDGTQVAQISPTLASPRHGYAGSYNFFDPDSYLGTAALVWSHDPFLQDQVRRVIERSGDFIASNGQLPHHFQNTTPVYAALSEQVQTGPNLFWVLSALNYAKASGDLAWLRRIMPKLRDATRFLYSMVHHTLKLAKVPGSLMIDVFIRANYTTDTNAALVGFFREFAAAERAVGNFSGARDLLRSAEEVRESVDAHLWREDHYVTQWDFPANASYRDFVDYDANLIAASFVANATRARKVFGRIDGGKCKDAPTWVSEKYYGRNDTTFGNIGDSACAMGRIAWFDALARRRFGDRRTFEDRLLGPLMRLLTDHTWLRERITCEGSLDMDRTPYYFEYPSVVVMMLHHIRYGIQMDFGQIRVEPFGPDSFSFHVGQVSVEFHPLNTTRLRFPQGSDARTVTYRLAPMVRGAEYLVSVGPPSVQAAFPCEAVWDQEAGQAVLTFEAPAGPAITIELVRTARAAALLLLPTETES